MGGFALVFNRYLNLGTPRAPVKRPCRGGEGGSARLIILQSPRRFVVPELPEVETVVRELRPNLVGRRITATRAGKLNLRKPWRSEWARAITGRAIAAVTRRGKWIIIEVAEGPYLVVHLGMTGQFTVTPAEAPRRDHTHLVFGLDDGAELRFRDVRRFGSATLFAGRDELDASFVTAGLGPEPFGLDRAYWRESLAGTNRNLKAVLLDQTVVAGVGNIYADESLFHARLHPAHRGRDLALAEADRLRRSIAHILPDAIERRGSSIRDYIGGSGERGAYQNEFRVYGRTGEACLRCKTAIVRIRLAGRSTHFCPKCQPARR
jgi:formamidopyrimidine-DNA glycosylase